MFGDFAGTISKKLVKGTVAILKRRVYARIIVNNIFSGAAVCTSG